jgi:ABC-type multidrug transport system fused ATPase/permease subunit
MLAVAIGILAGLGFTSMYLLDMSSQEFLKGLRLFFEAWDVQFSIIKSVSFGITVTGGVLVRLPHPGGPKGSGMATTRAVVVARWSSWSSTPSGRRCCCEGCAMSIEMVNVHKAFGDKQILKGFSLEVNEGETITVIGGSGSGKSVTLKHIVGLLTPDEGDVWVDGENVSRLDQESSSTNCGGKVGYVFQFAALFDSMTIAENVGMGLNGA